MAVYRSIFQAVPGTNRARFIDTRTGKELTRRGVLREQAQARGFTNERELIRARQLTQGPVGGKRTIDGLTGSLQSQYNRYVEKETAAGRVPNRERFIDLAKAASKDKSKRPKGDFAKFIESFGERSRDYYQERLGGVPVG